MASLELTLREAMTRYMAGAQTLRQLSATQAQVLHQASRRNDQRAIDLALEVELYLAEYQNGDCTLGELKSSLRGALETYHVQISLGVAPATHCVTTTSSVPLSRSVGIGFAVARG